MSKLPEILSRHENQIHADWLKHMAGAVRRGDLMRDSELKEQSRDLLTAIVAGTKSGDVTNLDGAAWTPARELLQTISSSRARQGFTPSETTIFVMSLKQPLFDALRQELSSK